MNTPRIACLMLTLNRAELTIECTEHNRRTAGMEFDLFMYDNGSTQEEFRKMYDALRDEKCLWAFALRHGRNDGVAKAFNYLIAYVSGWGYDLIVLLGNDIKNSDGWLKKMWEYHKAIPDSGLIALDWGCGAHPKESKTINGLEVITCEKVFGVTAIPNHIIDRVGYFCEDYYPYGLEDSDYNNRVVLSGYQNFYIPGVTSEHCGGDAGTNTEYRKMKDESLARNSQKYLDNHEKYCLHNHYYVGYGNTYEPQLNPSEL